MGKWFLRASLILTISLIIPYLPFPITDRLFITNFLSTVYTVIGIMFPLSLNQIMSFSFLGIERDAFVTKYRGELDKIRRSFVFIFAIATVAFMFHYFIEFNLYWKFIKFDIRNVYIVFLGYCLFYYGYNFVALAKLKNEIEDKIRETRKNQEAFSDSNLWRWHKL